MDQLGAGVAHDVATLMGVGVARALHVFIVHFGHRFNESPASPYW